MINPKVLLIVTGLPDVNGHGSSEFNLRFIESLERRNLNLTVLHLRSLSPRRSLISKRYINQTECYSVAAFLNVPGFSPIFLSSLFERLLLKLPLTYDVIHAVGGATVMAAGVASDCSDKGLVVQFIGSDVNNALPRLVKNKRFLEALEKAKFLCFNSMALSDKFASVCRVKNGQTKIIRRGADVGFFDFNFHLRDEIKVLFLGGAPNGNSKGAYTLIDAISILNNEQNLPKSLHFVIGGPSSRKLTRYLAINNDHVRCEVVGPISRSEVKKQLENSNVVVIPSLNEGIPNVLFEAMAAGNLVIASDVGGISEVLDNGNTGFLVEPNKPNQLAEKLVWVAENSRSIGDFARKGREVVTNFNYENFINDYIEIYYQATSIQPNSGKV